MRADEVALICNQVLDLKKKSLVIKNISKLLPKGVNLHLLNSYFLIFRMQVNFE